MPGFKRKTTGGPFLMAVGYSAAAPWGCFVVAGVTFVVACTVGLAIGRDSSQVFQMAAVAGVLAGLAVATFRYRYRHRIEPIWQKMRRGEFRPGGR